MFSCEICKTSRKIQCFLMFSSHVNPDFFSVSTGNYHCRPQKIEIIVIHGENKWKKGKYGTLTGGQGRIDSMLKLYSVSRNLDHFKLHVTCLLTSVWQSAEVKALHTMIGGRCLQLIDRGGFCSLSTMTNWIELCDTPPDTPLFAWLGTKWNRGQIICWLFCKRLHVLGRAATPLLKMAEHLHVLNNVNVDFTALD